MSYHGTWMQEGPVAMESGIAMTNNLIETPVQSWWTWRRIIVIIAVFILLMLPVVIVQGVLRNPYIVSQQNYRYSVNYGKSGSGGYYNRSKV